MKLLLGAVKIKKQYVIKITQKIFLGEYSVHNVPVASKLIVT